METCTWSNLSHSSTNSCIGRLRCVRPSTSIPFTRVDMAFGCTQLAYLNAAGMPSLNFELN